MGTCMSTRSNSSRERILKTAEAIILQKGFSATSIEDIILQAAVTKGGFFYHFSDRNALAEALVLRYLDSDDEIFAELFAQADELTEDPLHQLLIFLKLFADMMATLEQTHPGCLVASFTYEAKQLEQHVHELIKSGILRWRTMIDERLENIIALYPAKIEIDRESLADTFSSVIEGGIILSRVLEDNRHLANQILGYRNYIRLLFDAV